VTALRGSPRSFSGQVGRRHGSRVRPQFVQIVYGSDRFIEDMNDYVSQIKEHPFPVAVSFGLAGGPLRFENRIGQRPGVSRGRCAHQNEIVGVITMGIDVKDSQILSLMRLRCLCGQQRFRAGFYKLFLRSNIKNYTKRREACAMRMQSTSRLFSG